MSPVQRFHRLPDNLKATAYLVVASLFFSVMSLMIKLLGERLHITQILVIRQFGLMIVVMPAIVRNFPGIFYTHHLSLQLARVFFAMIAMVFGFSAVIHLPLADATAIFFAKSFFVTMFAVWFLGEVVGLYRWSAVAIGFLGVLVMLQPGGDNFSIWGLASVTGAAGAGMVTVIIRRLARVDKANTILIYQAMGVGLALLGPGIYFWQWPTTTEWIMFAGLAVVSYVAQAGNIMAYKWGEASMLASLDYMRLIWATLLGYMVFDAIPGVSTWVGASIVVAAALFIIHREQQQRNAAKGDQ